MKYWSHAENNTESGSHIICDFLSQVGLCDEDLGDFLTGSIQHTSHQWVLIIPESGSLLKATDEENNWAHTICIHTKILMTSPQCKSQLTARLVHHIKDKLLRFILHLRRHKCRLFLVWTCIRTPGQKLQWSNIVYPKLVEEQVKDLSSGHGAVYSYVSDWTISWSKYRCLVVNK